MKRALVVLGALVLVVATTGAQAQIYTDLYDFDGTHGAGPFYSILAQGRDGNLYGTTGSGGINSLGVVFQVTPSGSLTVLYNFDGVHGSGPDGGLTLGTDGNFYGTTELGGSSNRGTIFRITSDGELTILHNFTGGADGGDPVGPPVQGTDGSLYGTTNLGAAYEMTRSGTFVSLASLPGKSVAPLLLGTDGNFYGTTLTGGRRGGFCGSDGCGTVFKMTPTGIVTVGYNFGGAHGFDPVAPLTQGGDGDGYGTTLSGGSYRGGVIFKITPQRVFTVIHSFGDPNYPNDGSYPRAGVLQATDGNFYSATNSGGTEGFGVIAQISSTGSYSVLHNFDPTTGGLPDSTLVQHTNGKIYGLAFDGGAWGDGVIYTLMWALRRS